MAAAVALAVGVDVVAEIGVAVGVSVSVGITTAIPVDVAVGDDEALRAAATEADKSELYPVDTHEAEVAVAVAEAVNWLVE